MRKTRGADPKITDPFMLVNKKCKREDGTIVPFKDVFRDYDILTDKLTEGKGTWKEKHDQIERGAAEAGKNFYEYILSILKSIKHPKYEGMRALFIKARYIEAEEEDAKDLQDKTSDGKYGDAIALAKAVNFDERRTTDLLHLLYPQLVIDSEATYRVVTKLVTGRVRVDPVERGEDPLADLKELARKIEPDRLLREETLKDLFIEAAKENYLFMFVKEPEKAFAKIEEDIGKGEESVKIVLRDVLTFYKGAHGMKLEGAVEYLIDKETGRPAASIKGKIQELVESGELEGNPNNGSDSGEEEGRNGAAFFTEEETARIKARRAELLLEGMNEGQIAGVLADESGVKLPFPSMHQKIGVQEILKRERILIADEMGVGKTAQALLAFLELHKKEPAGEHKMLVICPSSLVEHWKSEILRYVTPEKALELGLVNPEGGGEAHGLVTIESHNKHDAIEKAKNAKIVVISYDMIIRTLGGDTLRGMGRKLDKDSDAMNFSENEATAILDELSGMKFDYVVMDEVHRAKNPNYASRAARIAAEYMHYNGSKKMLIACSGEELDNWESDLGDFCRLGEKQPKIFTVRNGSLEEVKDADIVIAPREMIEEIRRGREYPDENVYDESKIPDEYKSCQRSAAVRKLVSSPRKGGAKYLVLLTGTPLPSKIEDIGNMASMLEPDRYENATIFNQQAEKNWSAVRELLLRRMLRRRVHQIMELPKLTIEHVPLQMSDEQLLVCQRVQENEFDVSMGVKLLWSRMAAINPALLARSIEAMLEDGKRREKFTPRNIEDLEGLKALAEKAPSAKFDTIRQMLEDSVFDGTIERFEVIPVPAELEEEERELVDRLRPGFIQQNRTDEEIAWAISGVLEKPPGRILGGMQRLVEEGGMEDNPNNLVEFSEADVKLIEKMRPELIEKKMADGELSKAIAAELGKPVFPTLQKIKSLEREGRMAHNPHKKKLLIFSSVLKAGVVDTLVDIVERRGIPVDFVDGTVKTGKEGGQREVVRKAFQSSDGPQVLVAMLKTMSDGICCTAANRVVSIDYPYNDSDGKQGIARSWRWGQKQEVSAMFLMALGSVDENGKDLMEEKEGISKRMIDGCPPSKREQTIYEGGAYVEDEGAREKVGPFSEALKTPAMRLLGHYKMMHGMGGKFNLRYLRAKDRRNMRLFAADYLYKFETSNPANVARAVETLIKDIEGQRGKKFGKIADLGGGPAVITRVTGRPTTCVDMNPFFLTKSLDDFGGKVLALEALLDDVPLRSGSHDLAVLSLVVHYSPALIIKNTEAVAKTLAVEMNKKPSKATIDRICRIIRSKGVEEDPGKRGSFGEEECAYVMRRWAEILLAEKKIGEREQILREALRVVKKDGWVIMTEIPAYLNKEGIEQFREGMVKLGCDPESFLIGYAQDGAGEDDFNVFIMAMRKAGPMVGEPLPDAFVMHTEHNIAFLKDKKGGQKTMPPKTKEREKIEKFVFVDISGAAMPLEDVHVRSVPIVEDEVPVGEPVEAAPEPEPAGKPKRTKTDYDKRHEKMIMKRLDEICALWDSGYEREAEELFEQLAEYDDKVRGSRNGSGKGKAVSAPAPAKAVAAEAPAKKEAPAAKERAPPVIPSEIIVDVKLAEKPEEKPAEEEPLPTNPAEAKQFLLKKYGSFHGIGRNCPAEMLESLGLRLETVGRGKNRGLALREI